MATPSRLFRELPVVPILGSRLVWAVDRSAKTAYDPAAKFELNVSDGRRISSSRESDRLRRFYWFESMRLSLIFN
jgi:hypothetical protein